MGKRLVAAVDVGSSKVCSLLANIDAEGCIQVVGMGTCPSKGIHKGLVTDIDQASESIRESVEKAEQTSGERMGSVYLGISGNSIGSQANRSTVAMGRSAHPVSPKDIKRALTDARQLDLPGERRLLHVIPTQYTLDGQIGVKEPVGMLGFRLDVDTHVVTIAQNSAENIVKCVRKAGLNVAGLVLDCLASAQSVLDLDETDAGVVLADIGAGTTGISGYKNGSVVFTAVLSVGGNQISRDLAIGLGVPFSIAEQLKKQHCDLSRKNDNDETEEPAITVNFDGVGKIFKRDLNDIIRARVEEIIKLIMVKLPGCRDYTAEFPSGLVLTGGSAKLPGIVYVAREIMGLPTRVGIPRDMSGVADDLYDPAYASGVGALLCGGKWRQEQNWIRGGMWGRLTDSFKTIKQLVPRVKIYSGA